MGKVWGSDFPTDGKTFMWRVLKCSLFIGSRARWIGKSNGMSRYCKVDENLVLHIFSKYRKAMDYWNSKTYYHNTGARLGATIVDGFLVGLVVRALIARPEEIARLFVIS